MSKPPAFQLYAADFYMDTAAWTAWEVGIYFRLLMYEWINNGIPNEIESIARIVGEAVPEKDKRFNRRRNVILCEFGVNFTRNVCQKFVVNENGFLINSRLEKERKKQDEYRKNQIESGRKGGLKTQKDRRNNPKQAFKQAFSKPSSENQALQSSSSIIDTSVSIVGDDNGYSLENTKRIISYLNKKTGKNFKSNTKSTTNHIKARFNEKFKLEDFKLVIDNQTAKWKSDPKMIDYLRPETLFGTKFESYLQTKPAETEATGKTGVPDYAD